MVVRADGADDGGFEARLEERALGWVVGELDRTTIRVRGLVDPAEAAKELGAGCPVEVIAVQVGAQGVDLLHRGHRSGHVLERDGAVEPDHGSGVDPHQRTVEREDLRPVGLLEGRRLSVAGRNCRLQPVRARTAQPSRLLEQRAGFGDRGVVPSGAVLVAEQHQRA